MTTLYYLNDFSDEVMPCPPTLEAWAKWLSEPDEDWPHEIPPAGAMFATSTIEVLCDVRAEHDGERWVFAPEIPPAADQFFLRHHEGSEGWNAEFSSDNPQHALDLLETDETYFLACTRGAGNFMAIYQAGPPPRLILEPVQ